MSGTFSILHLRLSVVIVTHRMPPVPADVFYRDQGQAMQQLLLHHAIGEKRQMPGVRGQRPQELPQGTGRFDRKAGLPFPAPRTRCTEVGRAVLWMDQALLSQSAEFPVFAATGGRREASSYGEIISSQ